MSLKFNRGKLAAKGEKFITIKRLSEYYIQSQRPDILSSAKIASKAR